MSPAVKNGMLLVVLLAVVGVAFYFFSSGDSERGYDDTDESKTTWVCVKTGYVVELTSRQVNEWQESSDKVLRGTGGKQTIFWCPETQDYTLVRAQWCKDDNKYFPKKDLDGNSLNCPSDQARMDAGE